MRHSFASYHLALHMSPDKTAFELGHRDTKYFLDITANWYQQRMHKNTGTLGRKRNFRLLHCTLKIYRVLLQHVAYPNIEMI